ncbi:MAG TPA: hypothetical protein VI815_03690 [Candidatus Nanoarchaeia archaeon]|nr:hypothetical protein [Candidatus Nanoarchaeia archaeon]
MNKFSRAIVTLGPLFTMAIGIMAGYNYRTYDPQEAIKPINLVEIHEYNLTPDDKIDLVLQANQGPTAFINMGGGRYIPVGNYFDDLEEKAKIIFIDDKLQNMREYYQQREFYTKQMQAYISEQYERNK